jgi:drug/metabolite transporter (DMT)-like permease
MQWEARRLLAVSLATLGVIAVVYGGTTTSTKKGTTSGFFFKPTAPLLGNLLTLVASFGYGLYQVLYKIYAALPSDPEVASQGFYQEIPGGDTQDPHLNRELGSDPKDAVYPPPFGFLPNLLTSLIGFFTFVLLWIPIPFLHYFGVEIFRLPPNFSTVSAIAGIALSGMVFNAGFMASILAFRIFINLTML